ncbi:MAG: hypothetical protein H7A51_15000 [Akkermansiaceae bacterium]|nr:hypothetical protein [Akkermansiaceae bacterium]
MKPKTIVTMLALPSLLATGHLSAATITTDVTYSTDTTITDYIFISSSTPITLTAENSSTVTFTNGGSGNDGRFFVAIGDQLDNSSTTLNLTGNGSFNLVSPAYDQIARFGHSTGSVVATINLDGGVTLNIGTGTTHPLSYSGGTNTININDGTLSFANLGGFWNQGGSMLYNVGADGAFVVPAAITSTAEYATWANGIGGGSQTLALASGLTGYELVFTPDGGNTIVTANLVPEPSGAMLASLGGLLMFLRRRR